VKVKFLAIGLLALLAFGMSQRAEARGRCPMQYKSEYLPAPKHKAFATAHGGAPSSDFACGGSWGGSLVKVKADALKRCRGFDESGEKGKFCKIVDAQ